MDKRNIKRVPEPDGNLTDTEHRFAIDVHRGLSGPVKTLPGIYNHDKTGSRLYERICQQPEFYCNRAETEIIEKFAVDIAEICSSPLRVVELRSGSSMKVGILLEAFMDYKIPTTYYPIDISPANLTESALKLQQAYPKLEICPIAAFYEDGLARLNPTDKTSLLLWFGSGIGSYSHKSAIRFLAETGHWLSSGDRILLGVDFLKAPEVLEAAYNDGAGVAAAFNLNLLTRINRELGGNFLLEQFRHRAVFNPSEGRIEIYLISCCRQDVHIAALNQTFTFSQEEWILTEHAYKYSAEEIRAFGGNSGLKLKHQWFDSEKLFSLNLFEIENDRAS